MGYIRSLSISHLYKLIKVAREKEKDKEHFGMYCSLLPLMDKNNFKMFDEWKQIFKPVTVTYDMRSKDDIMDELLNR